MKAVMLDWDTMGSGLDVAELRTVLPGLIFYGDTDAGRIVERIGDAPIVLGNKVGLDERVFAACPGIRFIGLTATGIDNVDLDAARRRGIAVANIRAYCTRSVAEHVFACLLALARSLESYTNDVRAGAWSRAENFCLLTHPVRELSAMTLGVVGYGELGRGVEKIARAFDMNVIIAARPGSDDVPDGRVPFDEVLANADVISLHCPLNDATRGLFGEREFAAMKRSAILINTARGALVDSHALANALRAGDIAGAAIDVLAIEPPAGGDPLLDYDGANLVVTPHIAWGSERARQNAVDELAANIRAFLAGERRNRVD